MASHIMKLLLEHRDKYYPPKPPAPAPPPADQNTSPSSEAPTKEQKAEKPL